MMTRRFLICTLFVLGALLMRDAAQAQERLTDTLRVVNTSINPGDTGDVFIHMVNSEALGAYTLRLRFDPQVLGVVTVPGNDSAVTATQLRSDFEMFAPRSREHGVVTLLAVRWVADVLAPGRGDIVQFRFYVHEGVFGGTSTEIFFEDDPYDSNAYNWFVHWEGTTGQYRPVRVPGFITIGEAPALTITCPQDISIACDDSVEPFYTGEAIANNPQAAVDYSDAEIAGSCAQEFTIIRTWTATLDDEVATCDQTMYVVDDIPPEITCPVDKTIQFGESIDPANTGFAIAVDNCDGEAWVLYEDVETAGTHPIERVITRTWTASDHCNNTLQCVQTINELAENIPNSITCPADVTVNCDESTEPGNTGEAIPLNPEATVYYIDSITPGFCPPGFIIFRTWTADVHGNEASCSQIISVIYPVTTITEVKLGQNYPNPFVIGDGKTTYIDYDIPSPGRVNISIYDTVGRRIKTLVNEDKPASNYTTSWDGRDADGNYVPSGVYLYRLEYGGESIIKKMAIIR